MIPAVAKVFQGWFALFVVVNGYMVCASVSAHDWLLAMLLAPGMLYSCKCFGDSGSLG